MHTSSLFNFVALICALHVTLLLVAPDAAADTPSHNAFTYQGQLKNGDEPVTEAVNLKFRLFNAVIDGEQRGPELTANGFDAFDQEGRFTIDLAFGKGVFDGTQLWLEIEVNGTTLSPRQPIVPAPYSIRALNVATVQDSALLGTYTNPLTLSNTGNQFSGSFSGSGAGLTMLNASEISSGTLGIAHAPTGGNWTLASTLNLASNTLVVNPTTNRIGIGTASPTSALHVVASTGTRALQGIHTAGTGANYGGYFETASTSGFGAHGLATATSGFTYGLFGRSDSTTGRGVFGQASAATGVTYGIYGQVNSPTGFAGFFVGPEGSRNYFQRNVGIGTTGPSNMLTVNGDADFTGSVGIGTTTPSSRLQVVANSGTAIRGVSVNENAVRGEATGTNATAIFAWAMSETGEHRALWARSDSADGFAGFFSGRGYFSNKLGIATQNPSNMLSVAGDADFTGSVGIGTTTPQFPLDLVTASGLYGLRAQHTATAGSQSAIFGQTASTIGTGVRGVATSATGGNFGVYGRSESTSGTGVFAEATTSTGTTYGVQAYTSSSSGRGVYGHATSLSGTNYGVYGRTNSSNGYAGYFQGGRNYFGGNVGIGTENPAFPLDVETEARVGTRLTVGTGSAVLEIENNRVRYPGSGALTIESMNNLTVSAFNTLQLQSTSSTTLQSSTELNLTAGIRTRVNGNALVVDAISSHVGLGILAPVFQLQLSQNSAAKPTSNTWTIASDARLKKNIRTIEHALDDLLALRGVTYQWIDPSTQGDMAGIYTGFIAQEVESVFPEWIAEGPDGYKRLTVIGFEGIVVEALRELRNEKNAELASQQGQIDLLRQENRLLHDRLDLLEQKLLQRERN